MEPAPSVLAQQAADSVRGERAELEPPLRDTCSLARPVHPNGAVAASLPSCDGRDRELRVPTGRSQSVR